MTFIRRHRRSTDPQLEISAIAKWIGHAKTTVSAISLLSLGAGLLIHGVVMWRAQYKLEPRISHLEQVAAREEGILSSLDQAYVPRAEIETMRALRDKREAERDSRLGRVEDSLYKIQTAVTIIATRK